MPLGTPSQAAAQFAQGANLSSPITPNNNFTPAAGTLLLVCLSWWTSSATSPTFSISDTLGGLSWTQVGPAPALDSTHYFAAVLFYAIAAGGQTGKPSITVNTSAFAAAMDVFTVTGASGTTPIGGTGTASDNSGSATSLTATVSPSPASTSTVFAFLGAQSNGAITDPTGYTNIVNEIGSNGGSDVVIDTSYKAGSASASVGWTFGTGAVYQGVAVEIQPPAATPHTLPVITRRNAAVMSAATRW